MITSTLKPFPSSDRQTYPRQSGNLYQTISQHVKWSHPSLLSSESNFQYLYVIRNVGQTKKAVVDLMDKIEADQFSCFLEKLCFKSVGVKLCRRHPVFSSKQEWTSSRCCGQKLKTPTELKIKSKYYLLNVILFV